MTTRAVVTGGARCARHHRRATRFSPDLGGFWASVTPIHSFFVIRLLCASPAELEGDFERAERVVAQSQHLRAVDGHAIAQEIQKLFDAPTLPWRVPGALGQGQRGQHFDLARIEGLQARDHSRHGQGVGGRLQRLDVHHRPGPGWRGPERRREGAENQGDSWVA